jgi:4a-hydroxytetrahydrobiopterin dehydratase
LIVDGLNTETEIPLWALEGNGKSINREFVFANFKQAFEFMTLCAEYAEEIDHHPDWSNSWNKVSVSLSTHSAGTLTKLDIQLAKAMDAFASQVSSKN